MSVEEKKEEKVLPKIYRKTHQAFMVRIQSVVGTQKGYPWCYPDIWKLL